jgi:hypothetical protein
MGQDKQQAGEDLNGKKRRAPGKVARAILLLAAFLWTAVFILFLRTGYLSWIGCTVGAVFAISGLLAALADLTGKKRPGRVLLNVHTGIHIFLVTVVMILYFWPQNGSWYPYRFNDRLAALESERAVPDTNNAAVRYRELFAGMDMNDRPESVFNEYGSLRSDLLGRPWNGQAHPDAATWFDAQSDTLSRLLAIGQMKQCCWPIRADTYDDETVPYDSLRRCISMIAAAGNRDLGEGRLPDAMAKCFCLLQMADHLHQQTEHVDFLIGFKSEDMAERIIKQSLVENNPSDEILDDISRHMPSAANSWSDDWSRFLQYEKLRYINLLARAYEKDAEGRVRFAAGIALSKEDQKRNGVFRLYWLMNMPLDPHKVEGMADQFFGRFEALNKPDYPLASSGHGILEPFSPGGLSKALCNTLRWAAEFLSDGFTYDHLHESQASHLANRRGTWLMLGLREYKNEHGVWPESLDSIAPHVPAEAFSDPITGEAFVYQREGEAFRLYSKGPNRTDDAGRYRYVPESGIDEDDLSIWPLSVREPQSRPDRNKSQADANATSATNYTHDKWMPKT